MISYQIRITNIFFSSSFVTHCHRFEETHTTRLTITKFFIPIIIQISFSMILIIVPFNVFFRELNLFRIFVVGLEKRDWVRLTTIIIRIINTTNFVSSRRHQIFSKRFPHFSNISKLSREIVQSIRSSHRLFQWSSKLPHYPFFLLHFYWSTTTRLKLTHPA